MFIEAKYKGKIKISKKDIVKLPKKIGIMSTVQFVDNLEDIKKQLIGKKIFTGRGKQKYDSQILGCDTSSALKIKEKVDAYLYVGSGEFHPIAIGLLGKDVYILNPFKGNITKLDSKKIENYKQRKKGALLKFLNSKTIGILISNKYGQKFGNMENLIKKYKDKKFYEFVSDTLDLRELENFPFIDSWVNTACPRLDEDLNIVNINEI